MLDEKAKSGSARFEELSATINSAEKRLAEIAVLKTHIINYSKTRDVYVSYRKSGYSKKFFEAHREEMKKYTMAKHNIDEFMRKSEHGGTRAKEEKSTFQIASFMVRSPVIKMTERWGLGETPQQAK